MRFTGSERDYCLLDAREHPRGALHARPRYVLRRLVEERLVLNRSQSSRSSDGRACCRSPRSGRAAGRSTRPSRASSSSGSSRAASCCSSRPETRTCSCSAVRTPLPSPTRLTPNHFPAVSSYPLALINTCVSGGLLFLHLPDSWLPGARARALRASYAWAPPFRAWTLVVLFFFLSNVFLVGVPLVPPSHGYQVYARLPYWVSSQSRSIPFGTLRLTRILLAPSLTVARPGCVAHLSVRRRVLVRVVCVAAAPWRVRASARLGAGGRRVDAPRRAEGPGFFSGVWRRRVVTSYVLVYGLLNDEAMAFFLWCADNYGQWPPKLRT